MTEIERIPPSIALATFFERIVGFEEIVRTILSHEPLSADLCFRGEPERRVLLDFSSTPARVFLDESTRAAQIHIAVDSEIMHQILLGRLNAGVAFARRQLLLKGSGSLLARFIPLLDFAPLIYREHLADLGVEGFVRPSGSAPLQESIVTSQTFQGNPIPIRKLSRLETMTFNRINRAAYGLGYAVGTLRHRLLKNLSIFDVLGAMSRGMQAAIPRDERN